jgi:hypothetical protein
MLMRIGKMIVHANDIYYKKYILWIIKSIMKILLKHDLIEY